MTFDNVYLSKLRNLNLQHKCLNLVMYSWMRFNYGFDCFFKGTSRTLTVSDSAY